MNDSWRLLIVDDEHWVRENLCTILDWESLSITPIEPAMDGEDALQKLETECPDIMITDINMPFLNGNQLIKIAHERHPHVRSIVVSGYNDFAFVREALLDGAIDYLLKPVSRNSLLEVIGKAVTSLSGQKTREDEDARLHIKLLEAASLAQDSEVSSLLAEPASFERGNRTARRKARNLDLELAVFTLVLIRLGKPAVSPYAIKSILTERARPSGTIVFQNVVAPREFVLLTDQDDRGVDKLCEGLPQAIRAVSGSTVLVGVSPSYYTFDRLRQAYWEARSALSVRRLGEGNAVVRWKEAQKISVRKRVGGEDEKLLLSALRSGNKSLAREVIFDRVGIARCEIDGWLLSEAKQASRYLASLIFQHSPIPPAARPGPVLENMAELLDRAIESSDLREVSSLFDQVLDEAIGDPSTTTIGYSMRQIVAKVRSFIDEHYFEELSLTSLADIFRVDRAYLSRAYKEITGLNLMFAIAQKRIERAASLIEAGELSLSEIAFLVGYEEYAYFNRVFHKIRGMSPSKFKMSLNRGIER